jgi:diguanylate cyclase
VTAGQAAPTSDRQGPPRLLVEYCEDRKGQASIEDISGPDTPWITNSASTVRLGYSASAWWFRLTLEECGEKDSWPLLEIDYPRFEYIDCYLPADDGSFTVTRTGTGRAHNTRNIHDRNFVFSLKNKAAAGYAYLRIQSTNPINFTFTCHSLPDFIEARGREMPVIWIYYGLMLIMVLYNIFIFMGVGDGAYLHCSLFMVFFGMIMFSINGLGFQHLWPQYTWWENHSAYFFLFMCVPWLFQFLLHFIETK